MDAEGAWDEIQQPKLRWTESFQEHDGTQIMSGRAGIPYSAGKASEEDTLWEIQ